MVFNTPIFFLFFSAFFLLYSFVFLRRMPRVLLIFVASMVFYAGWNYRFIPLLVFSAVVDYFLAILIHDAKDQRRKKLLLSLSIIANLGVLAIFKYADFAIQSFSDLVGFFGYESSPTLLNIVLPLGISFYTFQSMSYTIDVYRGEMKPRKGLLSFATALSFFPQLVAGPILRAKQILPQLEKIPVPTWSGAKHGFVLVTAGLFKKTLADLLAGHVDRVFNSDAAVSILDTWTGVLAFAGQIYGDFSGYTDMAIGIALLLGFKIPINFRLPYFASSPVDFWRRWHISLSSWLRDYLYISLGGNRNNRYRNIFITMLLGGLWHGAAWTFVIWGFFHGLIIVATHYLSSVPGLTWFVASKNFFFRLIKWGITFYLVLIGWVFFRALNIDSAFSIIQDMHGLSSTALPDSTIGLYTILVIIALLVMHLFDYVVLRWGEKIENKRWLLWPLLFLINLICFTVGAPSDAFIYFQF